MGLRHDLDSSQLQFLGGRRGTILPDSICQENLKMRILYNGVLVFNNKKYVCVCTRIYIYKICIINFSDIKDTVA